VVATAPPGCDRVVPVASDRAHRFSSMASSSSLSDAAIVLSPYRAAGIFKKDRPEQVAIGFIEPVLVDAEHGQGVARDALRDVPFSRELPHNPARAAAGDLPRASAAAAPGNFDCPWFVGGGWLRFLPSAVRSAASPPGCKTRGGERYRSANATAP